MIHDRLNQGRLFSVGEGETLPPQGAQRRTVSIMTEAEKINTEIQIASTEYARLKGHWIEYQEALKKTSHKKYVDVAGHSVNRDSVLMIVRFLDGYDFNQCNRVARLKGLCAELVKRGASIENYPNVSYEGAC